MNKSLESDCGISTYTSKLATQKYPRCSAPPIMCEKNMQKLSTIVETKFAKYEIDFNNKKWHHGIPNTSGWYFIETNTPVKIFKELESPPKHYKNRNGVKKKCRNYNISKRARAIEAFPIQVGLIITKNNIRPIYSGMAINLMARAREHTFGHPGTAGLALANYSSITEYTWYFQYLENPFDSLENNHRNIILKFGEQIWRSKNGWPLLCAG